MINVLIIKEEFELARLWERALVRLGAKVQVARSAQMAIEHMRQQFFEIIVLDLDLSQGAAVGIADFASYRWPDTRVLFVTNGTFFRMDRFFRSVQMRVVTCMGPLRRMIWRQWPITMVLRQIIYPCREATDNPATDLWEQSGSDLSFRVKNDNAVQCGPYVSFLPRPVFGISRGYRPIGWDSR